MKITVILRAILALWLAASLATCPQRQAFAASLDTTADRVLGQPDFTSTASGTNASSLGLPVGIALDSQGNLFIADFSNNRVLEYDTPLTSGKAASRVFGQPDFTSSTANNGGVSANSLYGPAGVALDAQGNLFVADYINNRVLEYDAPLTSDRIADRVFGQPNFTSSAANNGGVSATSLYYPYWVALDAQGNLYVADDGDSRVLEYDAPLTSDQIADRVFGQPDFTSNTSGTSASSLLAAVGIALDAQGNLFVADSNNRVLEYDAPLTSDRIADRVFGQPDFTSDAANNGGVSAGSLNFPHGLGLDAQGNLYVGDCYNNRVLEYDAPLTSDRIADRVFGQPNFTSSSANIWGVGAGSLSRPLGLALDAQGNLYIADLGNSRVLEYDLPIAPGAPIVTALNPGAVASGGPSFILTVRGAGYVADSIVRWNGADLPTTYHNSTWLAASIPAAEVSSAKIVAVTVFTPSPGGGTSALTNLTVYDRIAGDGTADGVLGQPDFASSQPGNSLLPLGADLQGPAGVAINRRNGRLFVADSFHNRVLSWPDMPAFLNAQAADLVIGQPDFSHTTPNPGGVSTSTLSHPTGVGVDAAGNLYVADTLNNRVLIYTSPLASGMPASRVFGQGGSFTNAIGNNGGVSSNSLNGPGSLCLDSQGNLYVADFWNSRVLEYNAPLTTDTAADMVFGQPNFSSNAANNGSLNPTSLYGPGGLALDGQGNLYVADSGNNRLLEYSVPLTTGAAASRVFGQPNFTSNAYDNGGLGPASLGGPAGVGVDPAGNLYVSDNGNNRVLEYFAPLATDAIADYVFGQPDFTSNNANNGGTSASSLNVPFALALDSRGNLYVADSQNHRLLVYLVLNKVFIPLILR